MVDELCIARVWGSDDVRYRGGCGYSIPHHHAGVGLLRCADLRGVRHPVQKRIRETSQKFAHDFVDRTAFLNNNESKHATIDPPAEHVRGVVPRVCVMSARVRVEYHPIPRVDVWLRLYVLAG